MKWNSEIFWGFIDKIAIQESREEKVKIAAEKLKVISWEEQAEIRGLFDEYMEVLFKEPIHQVLVNMNGGDSLSEEMYKGCFAGIISNGRDFYIDVLEDPNSLQEKYPKVGMICLNELLHLI